MPRETVGSTDDYTVQVGWDRDHNAVQVGVEVPQPPGDREGGTSILDHLYGDQAARIGQDVLAHFKARGLEVTDDGYDPSNPQHDPSMTDAKIGRLVLAAIEGGQGRPQAYRSLWTITSRADVNALIRLLRKARDSAFGRDE